MTFVVGLLDRGVPTAGRRHLGMGLLVQSHAEAATCPDRSERLWAEAALMFYELAREGDVVSASLLISSCSDRADAGDEEAAELLNDIVLALPAETVIAAQTLS